MLSPRPGVAGAITEEITSDVAAKTAVLYLRVSTSEQATRGGRDEGFSIPAQREAGLRKAEALGAVVVAEFIDAGESGTSAEKRPDLQRMLTFVSEQPVDYCIVHKVDRLARNRADDVAIHFSLKQAGVTLVSVSENIDETPSGRLMHGIMSSIAEFYSLNLANEVAKGMAQKASLGGTVGRAPLGYKNVHLTDELGRINRTVHVDPDRAHLITWAFYRYAEGDCSLNLLLKELTARGLTTRPTPKWPSKPLGVSTLHKLLHNPYYKGQIIYGGAVYPGIHEPLVDPLTWQQVQDYLAANNLAGTRQRTKPHYLRGSVYCSCGSRLLVERATNRWGTKYEYFVCSGRKRKTTTCERQAMPVHLVGAHRRSVPHHHAGARAARPGRAGRADRLRDTAGLDRGPKAGLGQGADQAHRTASEAARRALRRRHPDRPAQERARAHRQPTRPSRAAARRRRDQLRDCPHHPDRGPRPPA